MVSWCNGASVVSIEVKSESEASAVPRGIVEKKIGPLGAEIILARRNEVAGCRSLSEEVDFERGFPSAVRNVRPLSRKRNDLRAELGENTGSIRSKKGKVIAACIQFEVCM